MYLVCLGFVVGVLLVNCSFRVLLLFIALLFAIGSLLIIWFIDPAIWTVLVIVTCCWVWLVV